MDKKIGMYGSIINLLGVIGFALGMLIGHYSGNDYLTYISCSLIAFGYLTMACAYCFYSKNSAGFCAAAFASVYAAISLLVLFAQLTVVQFGHLNDQALKILDYQRMGLYFNYDMLCYCFMAISTFFAGLTIEVKNRNDKWLKMWLMVHGIFAISCFIVPMFNVFQEGGSDWTGIILLEFWCAFFIPISILSYQHFKAK